MRQIEVTTDVQVDAMVKASLLPDPLESTSFEDLWKRANKTLTILGKSRFARRYFLAKIAHSPRPDLGMHLGHVLHAPENLFLSYDSDKGQGFYLRCVKNGATFEGPFIDYFIGSATYWFKAMQTPTGALRAIVKVFDQPDFTVADIDAEAVNNGPLEIMLIGQAGLSPDQNFGTVLLDVFHRLQFKVNVRVVSYDDSLHFLKKKPECGERIVIMSLRPLERQTITLVFREMSEWNSRRFFPHAPAGVQFYLDEGFEPQLFATNGSIENFMNKPANVCCALLSAMFAE